MTIKLTVLRGITWWQLNPSKRFWTFCKRIFISATRRRRDIKRSFRLLTPVRKFFFYQGFLHRNWRFTGQQGKGGDHILFHTTTSTRSRTSRHLFATLHVRWLSRIFNRNACVYQTATRWDLPPNRIDIWVIDWWCNFCLFTWWFDTRFLLQRFDIGNRWIWTRIGYHPCIINGPTNQVR